MLICPQCQFENPNTNKFCQRCGTSLTHKTCHECATLVPVNAANCQNCGAFTGTVWWAIISRDSGLQTVAEGEAQAPVEAIEPVAQNAAEVETEIPQPLISEADETLPPLESLPESTSNASETSPLPEPEEITEIQVPLNQASLDSEDQEAVMPEKGSLNAAQEVAQKSDNAVASTTAVTFLDTQQRYRLLSSQGFETITTGEVVVPVLDSQPFQKSLLEALMEQQQTDGGNLDAAGFSARIESDAWGVIGIPAIAKPYLALQGSYYPIMPEVHDAWQQDQTAVVLLEDRSDYQLLSELWGQEDIPTLQLLYWLDEMAKLWAALEPWHCRQSLLEESNLRVDEDQSLSLQRLYVEAPGQVLTLQDLGNRWQQLFNQSQRTQFTSLDQLLRSLHGGEIQTVEELRSHLEAIAHEQQSSSDSIPEAINSTEIATGATQSMTSASNNPANTGVLGKEGERSHETDDLPTVILPMQLLSLDDAGCTDIGQQRDHNEDSFGIQTSIKKQEMPIGRTLQARGLYILCDGMGGHAAGEVASAMAVDSLNRYFSDRWKDELPTEETIREAVHQANHAIYDVNLQNSSTGSGRMGTTLAMILIQDTNVAIAHVGDSRLYRLTRKRGLEQVTTDHEVGQREIRRGVEAAIAYSRPDAYQLTQALGPRSEQFVSPDIQFLELNEDTLFILCSDGLSDNDLLETCWQTHLAPLLSSRANLDQGILQLVELANEHNGHDNITVLLIRVKVRPNFDGQQLI
jgi:protein phosphatase